MSELNTVNLQQYNIFLTVAKTGNLSAASKKLFISQPAISKSIKKLEESLGCTLFLRSSRGVTLTDEGVMLFEHLEKAFDEIRTGEDIISGRTKKGNGKLRFGASNTLCKYLLLPKLNDYVKDNPNISISISCQSSNNTIELLKNKEIDIGLIAKPSFSSGLTIKDAGHIQDTFVAAPDYLKNHQDIFNGTNLMMLDKNNVTRTYIDKYISDYITPESNLLEIGSMDLLIEFAKTGLGIGCVIREFVEKEIYEGTLVEIKPKGLFIPKRQVCYAIMENNTHSDIAYDFLENYSV